jgi:hypothetical protein
MKYALLINVAEPPGLERDSMRGIIKRLQADGTFRGAKRLAPVATATTIRTRDGRPHVTAGAATRSAQPLAAFVIVESDEVVATEVAKEMATASGATIEVRPVAPPGGGGPDEEKAGVRLEPLPAAHGREFAFLINVADEKRPWPGSQAFDELMTNCGKVIESLEARSAFRGTERLADSSTARTVRASGGGTAITDGPFAEARELIGGFILGQCESQEEAVALAGLIPGAASGCVEVREVLED